MTNATKTATDKWMIELLGQEVEALATVQSTMQERLAQIKRDSLEDDILIYPELIGIKMVSDRIVQRLQTIKDEVDQIKNHY
jgi:hypothetical protein